MGIETYSVRDRNSLFKCDGLIIPGGESTTMSNLIDFQDLRKSVQSHPTLKGIGFKQRD